MKVKIGEVTKEQIIKSRKKESRRIEIELSNGWTAVNKVHKSQKNYSRKDKYKICYVD